MVWDELKRAAAKKVMENNYIFIRSPHYSNRHEPVSCIVMHYTAGGKALNTTRWFQNPQSHVSSHFVVGRIGQVYQCVKTSKVAWHAGASETIIDGEKVKNLNKCSIGIEISNRGMLQKIGDEFFCRYGRKMRPYEGPEPVLVGKNYWEPYPEAQIKAVKELLFYLDAIGIDTSVIVGHEEIALPKGRKIDPGPLFPWSEFRD